MLIFPIFAPISSSEVPSRHVRYRSTWNSCLHILCHFQPNRLKTVEFRVNSRHFQPSILQVPIVAHRIRRSNPARLIPHGPKHKVPLRTENRSFFPFKQFFTLTLRKFSNFETSKVENRRVPSPFQLRLFSGVIRCAESKNRQPAAEKELQVVIRARLMVKITHL